jgi:DNA-binding NarL/FixJ family response regulator
MSDFINLLIADDHQLVIDGIKSMLEKHPRYRVVNEALNGCEALKLIEDSKETIHILISDISMPGLTGIELCKKIKSFNSNIKVLILSMHDNIKVIKEAIMCEADGYILKNIGKEEFIIGLDALVENGSYFSHQIVPLLYQDTKKQFAKNDDIKLSKREIEVLRLIVKEFTSKEIAEKLFISKQTVDSHRLNMLEKTSSKSVVGLIKYAIQNGLDKEE